MWKISPKIIFLSLTCLMLTNGYQVNGIELKCEYNSGLWANEINGFCQFLNDEAFNGARVKIDSVEMINADGVSKNDVKALSIHSIPSLNYFPENLASHFENILGIGVLNSNLQEISSNDLKDFPKLRFLYLNDNKIARIEKDLFNSNPGMENIYLHNNQISHIDPNVFDNLENLNILYLSGNNCKQSFGDVSTRPEVINVIERIQKGECVSEDIMQGKKEAEKPVDEKQSNQHELNTKIAILSDNLTKMQQQYENLLENTNKKLIETSQQTVNEMKQEMKILSDFLTNKFSEAFKNFTMTSYGDVPDEDQTTVPSTTGNPNNKSSGPTCIIIGSKKDT